MDHHYPLHAISQQPRNWSTSDSNRSMQARWSQTSTSWYLYRRPRSHAAQLWTKVMRVQSQPLSMRVRTSTLPSGVGVFWCSGLSAALILLCVAAAASACFRRALSSNPLTLFSQINNIGSRICLHTSRTKPNPRRICLPFPAGRVSFCTLYGHSFFHLMLVGIATPCLPRACKRGGPAPWSFFCVCLDSPLRFNTLGKAKASSTNRTQNTSSKSARLCELAFTLS